MKGVGDLGSRLQARLLSGTTTTTSRPSTSVQEDMESVFLIVKRDVEELGYDVRVPQGPDLLTKGTRFSFVGAHVPVADHDFGLTPAAHLA